MSADKLRSGPSSRGRRGRGGDGPLSEADFESQYWMRKFCGQPTLRLVLQHRLPRFVDGVRPRLCAPGPLWANPR